jgi:hypothetical protein
VDAEVYGIGGQEKAAQPLIATQSDLPGNVQRRSIGDILQAPLIDNEGMMSKNQEKTKRQSLCFTTGIAYSMVQRLVSGHPSAAQARMSGSVSPQFLVLVKVGFSYS